MLGILAQRSQQEAAMEMKSPAAGHNKLTAGQLANLLDSRKEAKSEAEVKELAKLYGVDYEVVEALAKYVTSPSVESKSVIGPEGEAVLTVSFLPTLYPYPISSSVLPSAVPGGQVHLVSCSFNLVMAYGADFVCSTRRGG